METKQIWVLVIGALAIALVTSVISANITGNVIKVKLDSSKKAPQVYTTAEVDAKINNLFSDCFLINPSNSEKDGQFNCADQRPGSKCLFSEVELFGYLINTSASYDFDYQDDSIIFGPKDFFAYSYVNTCDDTRKEMKDEFDKESNERYKFMTSNIRYFCCLGDISKAASQVLKKASNTNADSFLSKNNLLEA